MLSRFVGQTMTALVNSENAGDLVELTGLFESGTVTPTVERTYPLTETPAAIQHMVDGRARGKIVVTM